MNKVYSRPNSLTSLNSGYCPGCPHGTVTKLICQTIDELEIVDQTTAILPVGCSSMGAVLFDTDIVLSPHGRAPAVATGYKRCAPERMVFCYQGDGDLASIGLSEIIHCANRGENIVVIFVNNCIYGMTGGQMAPTTLVNQKSTTTTRGRNSQTEGYPLQMCEIINQLKAPAYIARFALDTPANINKAKKGIHKAFSLQLNGGGFSFIEMLSTCSTGWGLSPLKSMEWLRDNMIEVYPLGVFREPQVLE